MSTSLLKLILSGLAFLLGAVVLVVSLLAATTVGSGDRLRSDPITLGEVQVATLHEGLVPFGRTTVHVAVTAERPVTLAVGHPVDVADLVAGVPTAEVTEIEVPGAIGLREVPGDDALPEGAAELEVWTFQETDQTVSYEYSADEARQSIVVFDPEGGSLSGVTTQVSVDTTGVFGLSLLGIALALVLLGFAAFGLLRWWSDRPLLPARGPLGQGASGDRRDAPILIHGRVPDDSEDGSSEDDSEDGSFASESHDLVEGEPSAVDPIHPRGGESPAPSPAAIPARPSGPPSGPGTAVLSVMAPAAEAAPRTMTRRELHRARSAGGGRAVADHGPAASAPGTASGASEHTATSPGTSANGSGFFTPDPEEAPGLVTRRDLRRAGRRGRR